MEERNRVRWIYASRDNNELAERYDEWAKSYDSELETEFAWSGPKMAAEYAVKYIPKDANILDAGAGTGQVAEVLSALGYANFVGIDLSEGMLEEARQKGCYRELRQMVLGERLDFDDNAFDAVTSVGVLDWWPFPVALL